MATEYWRSGLREARLDRGDPGNLVVYYGSDPVAGAAQYATITVPDGKIWRVCSMAASLNTGIAVANRFAAVIAWLDSGNYIWFGTSAKTAQTASQVATYVVSPGGVLHENVANDTMVSLPAPAELFLPENTLVRFSAANQQSADNWSYITAVVREWVVDD